MTMRDYRHCGHVWLHHNCASCQQQRYREDREKQRRTGRTGFSWRSLL